MMATLADYVSVRPRFARSANLERDSGRSEPLRRVHRHGAGA